jgi:hypothetical protein
LSRRFLSLLLLLLLLLLFLLLFLLLLLLEVPFLSLLLLDLLLLYLPCLLLVQSCSPRNSADQIFVVMFVCSSWSSLKNYA